MSNMVDYGFTGEQQMFRDAVRKFTKRELAPGAFERGDLDEIPGETIKKFADAGYLGLCVPEEHGGQGADLVTCGIVIEETTKAERAGDYLVRVRRS